MVNDINPPGSTGDFSGKRFGIIVSSYHDNITGNLLDGAVETMFEHRITNDKIDVVRVPGAWEICLAARQLAATGRYAGLICLGAVIRGETTHDQHINRFVSQAIGQLSLEYNLPVGFGVLTCNTFQQAHERSGGSVGNKGHEAASAMLEMVRLTDLTAQL
ncbi:MAG: 6,7-dimethyl-8-ribityllumazine synthase [Pirellulaceae bacterium]